MSKARVTRQIRRHDKRNTRSRLEAKGWIALAGIVGIIILISISVISSPAVAAQSSASSTNQAADVNAPPADRPQSSLGSPAIPVKAGINSKTAAGTTGPGFTTQDAVQWVKAHGVGRATLSGSQVVTRAEFLTSKQVSIILHGESVGLPDDSLVCYVEVQGGFSFTGVQGKLYSYPRGFVVFDAQNGYFLMAGGLP